jgi:hypothetical protein
MWRKKRKRKRKRKQEEEEVSKNTDDEMTFSPEEGREMGPFWNDKVREPERSAWTETRRTRSPSPKGV